MTVTMTTRHRQYQQAILAVTVAVVGMSVVLVLVSRHFDEQVSEEDPHNIRHPFYLNIL